VAKRARNNIIRWRIFYNYCQFARRYKIKDCAHEKYHRSNRYAMEESVNKKMYTKMFNLFLFVFAVSSAYSAGIFDLDEDEPKNIKNEKELNAKEIQI
jgi:hypothetical protein